MFELKTSTLMPAILNHQLSQKLKLKGKCESNHLINTSMKL
jgi:hypothetical protein